MWHIYAVTNYSKHGLFSNKRESSLNENEERRTNPQIS